MADNLTPVDFDPFQGSYGTTPSSNVTLTPVDHDPFVQPEQKSVLRDVAEQVPSGIYRGVSGLVGLPGSVAHGMRWLNNQAKMELGYPDNPDYVQGKGAYYNPLDVGPQDVQSKIEKVTGQLPEAQTTAGRYANAIGEQLGGSMLPMAGTVARGAELAPAAINTLTSAIGAGTAGEAAKDAGLGPGWQLAASLAGGAAAPGAANSAFSKGPADPRMIAKTEAAQAAQQEGIDVPKAAVAGSLEKPFAGRVASLPIAGAPIQNAARTALDQTQNRLAEIANAYGRGSGATAGTRLGDSLVNYIQTGSRDALRPLWQNVNEAVDQDMLHTMPATQQAAQALRNVPSATMRNINERALAPIEEDLAQASAEGGGLTYQGIAQTRTAVGNMLDDRLAPNYSTMEPALRRMYATLTQDLRGAAENAGGPEALQAFDRANAAERAIQNRTAELQKIVGRSGGNSGENVFETMLQMAQNKGKSADIRRLALARRSVGDQTWGDMSSAFIRRLGVNPRTGEFSPDIFSAEYGKLSPQGRNILFRGPGDRNELAQSLDRMQRVSQQFSELYRMGNPSGTGGTSFITSLLGGGTVGGLINPLVWVGSASTLGGMWGMSKYFASPANVDKMTRTLQARLAYTRNPNPTTTQRLMQASSSLSNSLRQYQSATNAQ